MPTAVIRPIKVGRIRITVRKPLFAPSQKYHIPVLSSEFRNRQSENNKRDDKIREKEKYIHTLHLTCNLPRYQRGRALLSARPHEIPSVKILPPSR